MGGWKGGREGGREGWAHLVEEVVHVDEHIERVHDVVVRVGIPVAILHLGQKRHEARLGEPKLGDKVVLLQQVVRAYDEAHVLRGLPEGEDVLVRGRGRVGVGVRVRGRGRVRVRSRPALTRTVRR